MFPTEVVEKIKTRILCSTSVLSLSLSLSLENLAVCETVWKNIVGPDRPQMTI